jgi:hypothetical protein
MPIALEVTNQEGAAFEFANHLLAILKLFIHED